MSLNFPNKPLVEETDVKCLIIEPTILEVHTVMLSTPKEAITWHRYSSSLEGMQLASTYQTLL